MLDIPGVRLSFLDGIFEIHKMPGRKHETWKERIGALLETSLLKTGIDFTPTGSLTLENESVRVKCEADKSYELGADRERPDLAIEVFVISGGIDKLEAYKRLQIPEVWFWEKSRLSLYVLGQEGYEQIANSQLLPELDIDLLVRFVNMTSHVEAVKEFKRAIDFIFYIYILYFRYFDFALQVLDWRIEGLRDISLNTSFLARTAIS